MDDNDLTYNWDEELDDFEPDDSQLEMGFNPYIGGYDFDC